MAEDCVNAKRRPWLGRLLRRACLAVPLLALAGYVVYILCGSNFHTVLPGRIYRSAQLSAATLERFIRAKGIRTVINLRGCCAPEDWYLDEGRITLRNNVSMEDLGFSAGRLPDSVMLRQLVETIDHSDYPILFHCHKGADRTGMASTIALLLRTDAALPEARKQLSFRYGHLPLGGTAHMDEFFDLYQQWLSARGLTHSPTLLRRWIDSEYSAGACRCRLELLPPLKRPLHLSAARTTLRVRCHNTSIRPWRLRPGVNSGVHLIYFLCNESGMTLAMGQAGLFHAEVPPGAFIDLTAVLPGWIVPGHYQLRLDMEAAQHAYFMQTGSQPLILPVEVP